MLQQNRICLRKIEEDDVTILTKWKNDKEIFQYLGGGYVPTTLEEFKKRMPVYINNDGNTKRFIIKEKNDNKSIRICWFI